MCTIGARRLSVCQGLTPVVTDSAVPGRNEPMTCCGQIVRRDQLNLLGPSCAEANCTKERVLLPRHSGRSNAWSHRPEQLQGRPHVDAGPEPLMEREADAPSAY